MSVLHARQTIREQVAQLITPLTTTAGRVYTTRHHRLDQSRLPCLLVYILEENVDRSAFSKFRTLERTLIVRIEGAARATSDLDDTLDSIGGEVEYALGGQLPGGVEEFYLQNVQIDYTSEGDVPLGVIKMDWFCRYRQTIAQPEEAGDTILVANAVLDGGTF